MPNPQQGSHSSHYCPLVFPPFLEKGKQCLWPTCSWTPCCSLPLPGSDHLLVFSFLATPGPADPATNSLSLWMLLWIKRCPVQPTDVWLQLAGSGKWGFHDSQGPPSTVWPKNMRLQSSCSLNSFIRGHFLQENVPVFSSLYSWS